MDWKLLLLAISSSINQREAGMTVLSRVLLLPETREDVQRFFVELSGLVNGGAHHGILCTPVVGPQFYPTSSCVRYVSNDDCLTIEMSSTTGGYWMSDINDIQLVKKIEFTDSVVVKTKSLNNLAIHGVMTRS